MGQDLVEDTLVGSPTGIRRANIVGDHVLTRCLGIHVDCSQNRLCPDVIDRSMYFTVSIIAARITVGIQRELDDLAETKRQTLHMQKQIAMQLPR